MRASLSSYVVIGSLLAVSVLAAVVPPENVPATKCGRGMTTTNCAPCSRVCNQPPRPCALFCVQDKRFCVCKDNYSLPDANSTYCIPTDQCPPKDCPKGYPR